jgi:hypothetical protein
MRQGIPGALIALSLSASCLGLTSARSDPPAGKEDRPEKPPRIPSLILERDAKEEQTVRKNGVIFAVSTKVTGHGERIDLHWELTYNGPRSRLIVVKPALDIPTGGQMGVVFWAAVLGRDYAFTYGLFSALEFEKPLAPLSGIFPCFPRLRTSKDWFLSIPAGQSVRGSITFAVKQFKDYFLRVCPEHYFRDRAPQFYVQVHYTPVDRGEEFNLDAWTGDLTPVAALRVQGPNRW